METIKKFLYLLNPIEQIRASILLVMIFVMALLEMIGVVSILPFMAVLTNPTLIETNLILIKIYKISEIFGVKTNQQFLFVLGVLVFILLVTSLFFKALTTYAQLRFVQMREFSISKRLIEGYLYQPYSWFLNQNSADLGKTILSEVATVIDSGFTPLMELLSKGMVAIILIGLLIFIDPLLALVVGSSLGITYGIIFYFTHNYFSKIGKERLMNNRLRFISTSEAFGAIKEVKLGGLENGYINRFSNSAQVYARTQASAKILSHLPRHILEAIAFGGILLMIIYLILQTGSFNNAIPIISLYVFAGYRLIPALQLIYQSISSIKFIEPSLDKLCEDIKNLKSFNSIEGRSELSFNESISLKNIEYCYPNSSNPVLKNVNMNIPARSTIGIVGASGSGKTTVVDITLGLLKAQNGIIQIDNQIITDENLRSWQRLIGYVPQHIYLSDNTILANIAFGVEPKNINKFLVEKAAKTANLHNFIMNDLSDQYLTNIGERGVKLSGGQRQRIGIARALYHNPKILILDEATSALDNLTEQAVMDAVNNLSKNITIILIAHRLNTVKICDKIYQIEKGKIIKEGNYDELFRKY